MASNGLLNIAKKGRCQICQRVRNTNEYLKIVDIVKHGYATGHRWACKDPKECREIANRKLESEEICITVKERILLGFKIYDNDR